MGTAVVWEGNIGSVPEFKEFPNGNKDPRRLCRLNVYFDNSVPRGDSYEDRGGFWANVEIWHTNAKQFASLYQKGMRVLVQGRAVMDNWEKDGEEYQALKVQASRVGILPHRIEQVVLGQNSNQARQGTGQAPRSGGGQQQAAEPEDFDQDIPF